MTFLQPVKPWRCTTGPVEPVNGINKDVCGTKLQPTQLSWPILWIETVYVTYWTHSIAVCVLKEALTHLQLPITHALIHAICVITVAVRKVAQSPAVLAI